MSKSYEQAFVAAILCVLAACSPPAATSDTDAAVDATWMCPADWVPLAQGGCGPAVVVCVPDGGARTNACAAVDTANPHSIVDPDGGAGSGFYLLPDGAIAGGWPLEGAGSEVPARDANPLGVHACAPGWQRTADGSCDPALATACTTGGGALPGGGCTHTQASDCPGTPYADVSGESGTARVVRVSSGASASGADGSAAHPFPTLAAGLAAAGPGGWILVGDGTYAESVAVTADVHLIGTCAARVRIAPASGPSLTASSGAIADVRSLTLAASDVGLRVAGAAHVTARDLAILQSTGFAVDVSDPHTELTLDQLFIESIAPAATGTQGAALHAHDGASLRGDHVAVRGYRQFGAIARSGASLALADAALTAPGDAAGTSACGSYTVEPSRCGVGGVLATDSGTSVTLERTVVDAPHAIGLHAEQSAALIATDVVVHAVTAIGARAIGLGVTMSGHLTAHNVLLDGCEGTGIRSATRGRLELTTALVRGTGSTPLGATATGVLAAGNIVFTDVKIERGDTTGLQCSDANSTCTLDRVAIVDTITMPPRRSQALVASTGAIVEARHVRADGFDNIGIGATGLGTSLEVSDAVIHGRGRPGIGEIGLVAIGGARVFGSSLRVEAISGAGLFADNGESSLTVEDSRIGPVDVDPTDEWGPCLLAQGAATANVTRSLFTGCRGSGVWALSARVALRDDIIRDVVPNGTGYGMGVFSISLADVTAERLAIESVASAGIVAGRRENQPDISAATIEGSDIFVRGVSMSTIEVATDATGRTIPAGAPVAYGIHAADQCAITLERAVITGAAYGFYDADGTIDLRSASISSNSIAAGSIASPVSSLTLMNVALSNNASNEIVTRSGLPRAATLENPSDPCATLGCL